MSVPIEAGERRGMLVILEKVGRSTWACHCDCGVDIVLTTTAIQANRKSCGCQAKIKKDMLGVRKGKLVAIAPAPTKDGQRYWLCKCDCGKETILSTKELGPRSGRSSCGCIREEAIQNAKKWKPDPRREFHKKLTEAYGGR
jgi:hypothetical protein